MTTIIITGAIIFGILVGIGCYYITRYHEAMGVVKALREDLTDAYIVIKDNDESIEELNDKIAKYESELCELNAWKDDISKRKSISEDELDKLAEEFCDKFEMMPTQRNDTDSGFEYGYTYNQLTECYKASYRKAMEEK